MKSGHINHAENWSFDTQIIHGILNKEFSKFVQRKINSLKLNLLEEKKITSYHFTQGLVSAINLLIKNIEREGADINPLAHKFKTLIIEGKIDIISTFFEKVKNIATQEELEKLFDDVLINKEYLYGDFELLDFRFIEEYYKLMNALEK